MKSYCSIGRIARYSECRNSMSVVGKAGLEEALACGAGKGLAKARFCPFGPPIVNDLQMKHEGPQYPSGTLHGSLQMVPKAGLEPARVSPLPPQDSVSTRFHHLGKKEALIHVRATGTWPVRRVLFRLLLARVRCPGPAGLPGPWFPRLPGCR